MSTLRLLCLVSIFCLATVSASSQLSTPTSGAQTPQGTSILQQSLAAMTGGAPINDVTMSGTVTVNTGNATQAGTITLVATAAGQSQLTLALPSGSWVTTENYATSPRTSSLAGPNGTTPDTAPEDLTGPHPAWFCPALLVSAIAPQTYVASYVGQETRNGSAVQHVSIWPQANNSVTIGFQTPGQQVLTGPGPSPPPRVGQQDLYVDSSSALPVAIVLRIRGYKSKDNNPDLTQPVLGEEQVEFSNYQSVQGRAAPFHIQVSMTGISLMDIKLSSVTFNTGAQLAAN